MLKWLNEILTVVRLGNLIMTSTLRQELVRILIFVVVGNLILTSGLWLLWNWLLPSSLRLSRISWIQALGLLFLLKIIQNPVVYISNNEILFRF
jgi:uncharacterized membrane protein